MAGADAPIPGDTQSGLLLLLDSFAAIASERDANAILEQAVDLARLLTRARYGAAVVLDGASIGVFAHRGLTQGQVHALGHPPEGRGMLGAVLEDRATIRMDRLQDDPRSVGFPLHHVAMSAFLGVPILFEDELIGALYLTKPPGQGTFTDLDELFMLALARQTGVAVKAARLLEEKERTNEELRLANQLKSEFVAVASHELQTPVAPIAGFASTLVSQWDELSDDRRREYVHAIDRQAKRLSRLVNDLLTTSRIEAGRVDVRAKAVSLGSIVAEALVEVGAGPSDIRLSGLEDVRALADPDLVQRIVVNYVGNALKYGEPPFAIEARQAGEWVELRMRDAGGGIAAEFVPRLFGKFARETGASVPGTGLGLFVVRGLARAQGGDAWYESNHPRGSCFAVRLPAAT